MSDEKLQWMYKGISGLVEREEYLLGRKVDKTFEILEQEEKQSKGDFNVNENDFTNTLFEKNATTFNTVTVDLNAKVREDPLYEIRKKQVEERKKIIENPIKMKRIKQMLEKALKEEESSEDSDSSGDDYRRKRTHRSSSYHRRNSRESDASHKKSHRDRESPDRYRRRRHKSRSKERRFRSRSSEKKQKSVGRERKQRSRSSEKKQRSRSDEKRHRSRSAERRQSSRSNEKGKPVVQSKNYRRNYSKQAKTKLSAEELEKRRNEMLESGTWREQQRKKNVESYKEEAKQEAEESKDKSASFLKPMINSALDVDSVEKRIKQKLFKVQREHNAMDKNFIRR